MIIGIFAIFSAPFIFLCILLVLLLPETHQSHSGLAFISNNLWLTIRLFSTIYYSLWCISLCHDYKVCVVGKMGSLFIRLMYIISFITWVGNNPVAHAKSTKNTLYHVTFITVEHLWKRLLSIYMKSTPYIVLILLC